MTVEDILITPNADLSDDDLELKIAILCKMRITKDAETELGDEDEEGTDVSMIAKRPAKIKSNASRRAEDLFSKMTPEQLAKLDALLAGGK